MECRGSRRATIVECRGSQWSSYTRVGAHEGSWDNVAADLEQLDHQRVILLVHSAGVPILPAHTPHCPQTAAPTNVVQPRPSLPLLCMPARLAMPLWRVRSRRWTIAGALLAPPIDTPKFISVAAAHAANLFLWPPALGRIIFAGADLILSAPTLGRNNFVGLHTV